MHEYGMTPRQFFHDLTPPQIESLERSILRRHIMDEMTALGTQHHDSPAKRMDYLKSRLESLEPDPEYVPRPFTDEDMQTFNIHIHSPQ